MIAFGAFIGAFFWLQTAFDPPIPDFRKNAPELPDLRALRIPEVDDENLQPLHTLASLVVRAVSARLRVIRYKNLAWAAFLDRDEPRRIELRDAAHSEIETLRRLVPATMDAADEAHEIFEQLIREVRELPGLDQIRETSDRFASELGLPATERALVDERLKTVDEQLLRRGFERVRAQGFRMTSELVRGTYEMTTAELANLEYLS